MIHVTCPERKNGFLHRCMSLGCRREETGRVRLAMATAMNKARLEALEVACMVAIPGAAAALARLNVFQALAQAGENAALTAPELADRALPGKAINVRYLARLLRLMAAKNILREDIVVVDGDGVTERRYALTPVGQFLADDSALLPQMFMFQFPGALLSCWEHIHESVLDDSVAPFVRAHQVSPWEYLKQNPEFEKVFNNAMAGTSHLYMQAILETYRGFEQLKVLVDVGGGVGSAIRLITARYPHIKGINFDQPHVIHACAPIPGVELVGGDMFKSVPSGGDAIFMKYILHDWDDESCLKLLKNCCQALPPHGKVIALDHVLPEIIKYEGGDHMSIQMDIHMMAFNVSGACERTEREFREMGLAAGFKRVEVICNVDELYYIIEFRKAA